jgi:hypothetical protein
VHEEESRDDHVKVKRLALVKKRKQDLRLQDRREKEKDQVKQAGQPRREGPTRSVTGAGNDARGQESNHHNTEGVAGADEDILEEGIHPRKRRNHYVIEELSSGNNMPESLDRPRNVTRRRLNEARRL